jgi:hypothetical protein
MSVIEEEDARLIGRFVRSALFAAATISGLISGLLLRELCF